MSFDVFVLFGGVIAALIFIMPVKEIKSGVYPIAVCGIAILVTAQTLRSSQPLMRYINGFMEGDYAACFKVLIKVLGITLATNLTSDIAAEMGAASLSGKVDLAGKIAILLCALPLFETLLTNTVSLV